MNSDGGSSEEFFEKFEGYTIPKKKPIAPKSTDEETPMTVTSSVPCPVPHPDDTKTPMKAPARKVSKRSASDFLRHESDDEATVPDVNRKDPLGLEPILTYGEAKMMRHTLAEEWFSRFEGEMPEFIVDKCTDSQCEVCQVTFDSRSVAKTHYAGKPHTKKCIQAMHKWNEEDPSRNIIPTLKQHEVSSSADDVGGSFDELEAASQIVDEKYCSICDIELSSKVVADSHYQGKNHAKQLRKLASGTYVPKHKRAFPELKKPKLADFIGSSEVLGDSEGRQGSGNRFFCLGCHLHFSCSEKYNAHLASSVHKEKASGSNGESKSLVKPEELVSSPAPAAAIPLIPNPNSIDQMLSQLRQNPKAAFECSLCKVQCTSQDMLSMHLNGKSHKKKLALLEYSGTPGGFKCEICNIETTDANGLQMHMSGKKHLKKVAAH